MLAPTGGTGPSFGHHGKGWGEAAEKGWSDDHPVCEEHPADESWCNRKRRCKEQKDESGGGCKKQQIEMELDDRGCEDNKFRSKEAQHDRYVPHTPHNTAAQLASIFSSTLTSRQGGRHRQTCMQSSNNRQAGRQAGRQAAGVNIGKQANRLTLKPPQAGTLIYLVSWTVGRFVYSPMSLSGS